jgi:glutaconyl-CoA/methylmalonyl-CoA decarboxylase subunit gamma
MKLRITVEGFTYDVDVEVLDSSDMPGVITAPPVLAAAPRASASRGAAAAAPPARSSKAAPAPAGAGEKACKSPIAGTITQVKVKVGDKVGFNQVLLIMEAMKMETNIASPVAGTVKSVNVSAGQAVKQNQVLVEFE